MIALEGRTKVTKDWLCGELERYRSTDDVFCDDFLSGVIFAGAVINSKPDISPDAYQLLKSLGTKWMEVPSFLDVGNNLLPGPYLACNQVLLEVFRLYDDTQGAFMNSIVLREQT